MTVPEESMKVPVDIPGIKPVSVASQHPPIQAWTEGTMPAVNGESTTSGAAVFGRSKASDGVHGESSAIGSSGVAGINDSAGGHGIYGKSSGGQAGWFDGHVTMNGDAAITGSPQVDKDITFTGGDAGAGHYRPALVLDKGPSDSSRVVVSLMGKAFYKVDASYGAISVGDLLTSSPEPGHAMVAESRERSFGTVVGKALGAWPAGKGMIPIILALQ